MKYRVLTGVSVDGKQWTEGQTLTDDDAPKMAIKEWLDGGHIESVPGRKKVMTADG